MKRLIVDLTDEEAMGLAGVAVKLEKWEKFIPAGLLPIVKMVETALLNAEEV